MKKLLLSLTLIFAIMTSEAFAQFGGVVYDPTNYHNALLRYFQLQQQLTQLKATYSQIRSQYALAQQMATSLENMPSRYKAQFTNWQLASAPNTYGTNTQWLNGINKGNQQTVFTGYQKAVTRLNQFSAADFSTMSPETVERRKSQYAEVELSDGANMDAMLTIGSLRQSSKDIETKINNLEQDSLSASTQLNSEVAVLNKINASNVLMLRSVQDTNKLLVSLLEQQLAFSKRQRDPSAEALNNEIAYRARFNQAMSFTSTVNQSLAQKLHIY